MLPRGVRCQQLHLRRGVLPPLLLLLALLAQARQAGASCANKCHYHGTCLTDDTCSCFTGWTGSDCSLSECGPLSGSGVAVLGFRRVEHVPKSLLENLWSARFRVALL
jgi:hypothetical protein